MDRRGKMQMRLGKNSNIVMPEKGVLMGRLLS
jgi:hypothetical protein